jgi:hypothetical protein
MYRLVVARCIEQLLMPLLLLLLLQSAIMWPYKSLKRHPYSEIGDSGGIKRYTHSE